MSDFSEQELFELQLEMASIEDDFAELSEWFDMAEVGGDTGDSDELSALDAELEEAGLGDISTASTGELSLMGVIDGDFDAANFDEQGIWGGIKNRLKKILKGRAARIIRKIVRLVRKHRKLATCVPKATKAVALFKTGRYRSALKAAWSTYRCIRKHM
ncbi:MAG: hypothetical protein AB8G16_07645 [Gammaproteobacteria bacterium]